MSNPTYQEEWRAVYENEVEKFEQEFHYTPEMDEFISWYLEGDVRIGEE